MIVEGKEEAFRANYVPDVANSQQLGIEAAEVNPVNRLESWLEWLHLQDP